MVAYQKDLRAAIINQLKGTAQAKDIPEDELVKAAEKMVEFATDFREKGLSDGDDYRDDHRLDKDLEESIKKFVDPDDFLSLVKASGFGVKDFKGKLSAKAKALYDRLTTGTARQSEDGRWDLIYKKETDTSREKTEEIWVSNAWVTAISMWALSKVSKFLKIDPDKNGTKGAIDRAMKWLFSDNVLQQAGDCIGWVDIESDVLAVVSQEGRSLNYIKLNDTANTFNIVVRIRPGEVDYDYESIVKSLLRLPEGPQGRPNDPGWYFHTGELDLAGTCYGLRALANYRERYEERRKAFESAGRDVGHLDSLKQDIEIFTNNIAKTIVKKKIEENQFVYWPEQAGFSRQANTALAVLALRTSGYGRDWPMIVGACTWLLSQKKYQNEVWCWTEKDKDDGSEMPSVKDSALILSALMKGSTWEKFAEANAVMWWLYQEVDEKKWVKTVQLVTVLCAFADYLRAYDEPGFFPPLL